MANLQNPHLSSHLRSGRWAVPAKTMIRVPVDKEQVVAEYFKSPSAQRKSNRLVAIQDHQLYRVNRGDTLSDIAREFGVSLKSLKQANRLATGEIRIGQELIIPR